MALTPKQEAFARAYVYLLIDPRDGEPFYVGKGQGRRAHQHLQDAKAGRVGNLAKHRVISELLSLGLVPDVRIIFRGSEREALKIERLTIAEIGRDRLTNVVAGNQDQGEVAAAQAAALLRRFRPFDEWAAWWKLHIGGQGEGRLGGMTFEKAAETYHFCRHALAGIAVSHGAEA